MTTSGHEQAMIDWIVAHGEPMGTFGTVGKTGTQESRADLARTGIDYAASLLGDLTGESWTEDSYADAQTHPGLWADVVPAGPGEAKARGGERWFVSGGTGITLSMVISGVLEAGTVGADYWRRLVTDEHAEASAEREAARRVCLAEQARRQRVGGRVGRLP